MVYLVGAGPGDPGLITVKALELLGKADVVLYDRLVESSLLYETKPACVLIDVGKKTGKHTKTQNEIIDLLVKYGSSGQTVVRLKGGDPFLFGRGGEEAERLGEEGIPFAIVPGVSALNAVTAYAGIPVTHRDYASSVGIATGHGAGAKSDDPVRWREMARAVDTIVVFMGVGTVGTIVGELVEGGLDKDTPAAVVEHGTTPAQRIITGTLETIADVIREEAVSPPALLVIGKTASLTGTLDWYKPGPLAGLRIGITRPLSQAKAMNERLVTLGARNVPMPTIKTVDTIDTDEVREVMRIIPDYDFIVFSSVNGVDSFFRALKTYGFDARALFGTVIACIGPVTAEACERYGVRADLTAERFIAEGLVEALFEKTDVKGKRFLLVRSDIGRNTLNDELTGSGALVSQAVFYSTQREELTDHTLELISAGGIDMITFTSSSTVDNFFAQTGRGSLNKKVKLASIGPQTSKTIRYYGHEPYVEATVYTTEGLVDAILDAETKKPR